ncbi:hypothetical protein WOLCODRAFT_97746 [Wolfiporia cocos MD-104 SS10]|uniref:C2H2-type domain-containing protein n=1 Tax=Wolfiporia cocos (strain MD-104) TaxID=742152 RepID=A0A2H3JBW7_WOLCO|nr:hypothetical protein WOLCODRAFT_97746 [Wolfiporia cocos MD-104 SS10]
MSHHASDANSVPYYATSMPNASLLEPWSEDNRCRTVQTQQTLQLQTAMIPGSSQSVPYPEELASLTGSQGHLHLFMPHSVANVNPSDLTNLVFPVSHWGQINMDDPWLNVSSCSYMPQPFESTALSFAGSYIPDSSNLGMSFTENTHRSAECRWGVPCGQHLIDLTAAGIVRHLKQNHFDDTTAWRESRGPCRWSLGNLPCGQEMLYAGFGKHIATVHLQSTVKQCPQCRSTFSRSDSLARHRRDYCPMRNRT